MRKWWGARSIQAKVGIAVVVLGLVAVVANGGRTSSPSGSPTATVVAAASSAASTIAAPPTPATTGVTVSGARTTTAPASSAPPATVTGCQARGPLPDPVCTPGAADPRVTQANIGSTICVSGYTTTVRPPVSYTDPLKVQQMQEYGFTGTIADFEEDHLIALEIGGDPRDPHNLWPEPRTTSPGASQKDTLENRLHADVCAGRISLAEAQREIATDWVAAAGLSAVTPAPTAPATSPPTSPPVTPAPTATSAATPPPATTPPPAAFSVTITASQYGSLGAVTAAGASCTARALLPSGSYSGAQGITVTKVADTYGAVSWTYTRVSSTTPGTGTHTVTCTLNGQTMSASASFTVP